MSKGMMRMTCVMAAPITANMPLTRPVTAIIKFAFSQKLFEIQLVDQPPDSQGGDEKDKFSQPILPLLQ